MKRLSLTQRQRLIAQMQAAGERGGPAWNALYSAWAVLPVQVCLPLEALLHPDFRGICWAWGLLGLLNCSTPIDPIGWNISCQGIGAAHIIETALMDAVLVCQEAPHLIGLAVPPHIAPRVAVRRVVDEEYENEEYDDA